MLNRLLFLTHRWTGVALALFMLLWFASGLVIVYSSSINQSRDQQLAHAEPLRLEANWLSFGAAWERSREAHAADKGGKTSHDETGIVEARLARQGGLPLWLAEDTRGQHYAISAIDGHLWRATSEDALKIAADWLIHEGRVKEAGDLRHVGIQEKGASILRGQDTLAPFHRISLQNILGGEIIVSATTGEVVQVSNALERGTYWAGNWLHLFRFFDSAGFGSARGDVLMWSIIINFVSCVTGLIVGWLRWRPGWGGKPTYKEGRVHPYRAFWFRWHFWAGLIGGIVATLWAFSGVVSSLQSSLYSPAAPTRDALAQYYGAGIPEKIRNWQPEAGELAKVPAAADIVQLAWRRLGDDSVLLAHKANGERIALDAGDFSETKLTAAVWRLAGVDAGTETEVSRITEYDHYFYLRHRRSAYDRPLPALLYKLNDNAATHVYLDPQDGRVLLRNDAGRRQYRWLFSALHHWDLPGLYRRPVWDVWMLIWIAFGLTLGTSSVVLGVKRLKVTFIRWDRAKENRKSKGAPEKEIETAPALTLQTNAEG
ncbi:hypothetical protein AGMMS49545_19830 [Betaproteobacteria bacterium]|nr:hypothetical protein AGMMS49545_19830 [Betaproteobacteria bacterium]GHU47718.1 hypothetical protein AGMMS50289_23310 [Betaproteobacteria bacterium]